MSSKINRKGCEPFEPCGFYWHWCPSVPWDGHKYKGSKTLSVSTAKHGNSHVTNIDMLTLQFTTPAACPCSGRYAFRKQLACSHLQSVSSTVTLVCWLITSMTLGRISGRYNCHSVKCNMNQRGWGENSGTTVHVNHTHCWLGRKGWVSSCHMIMSRPWLTKKVWHVRDCSCHSTLAYWTRAGKTGPGPLFCRTWFKVSHSMMISFKLKTIH